MFNLYINNLLKHDNYGLIEAYADDLKLYGNASLPLQKDLDYIKNCAFENSMEINSSNCEVIHFHKNNPIMKYYSNSDKIPATNIIVLIY